MTIVKQTTITNPVPNSTMTSVGMSGACKVCGGVNLEIEDRGSKVCRDCGHVLEDSCIVSEVQFEENARGKDMEGERTGKVIC